LLFSRQPAAQVVPVHERCDTPVEFVMSYQWFIRVLDHQETWLKAGEQLRWHPEHMGSRYRSWVENLAWDWCISRQRAFGVPLPLWYCADCGEISLAEESALPVDPLEIQPGKPCSCGSERFIPEEDVFDTWMTSSMTPQIAAGFSSDRESEAGDLYRHVFPFRCARRRMRSSAPGPSTPSSNLISTSGSGPGRTR
jgi:valyl-tRNA synthetase